MNKVLLLGAGLVSRPLVHYLTDVDGVQLTVATRTVSKAEALLEGRPNGVAVALDVADEAALSALIAEHEVTISLLPYTLHVLVAGFCLQHKRHLITTSYVSDGMRALDAQARDAGLLFLNEIGVDPGIDHMTAMEIIHGAQAAGGKIETFYSFCGGLPAPDANDNPFGYKFSWSPRGVVLAGRNNAKYLQDGQEVDVPGPQLFAKPRPWAVPGFGELEVYPNRNSVHYREIYGIPEIKTLMRGTFRNVGWCETLKAIADLGLLDDTVRPELNGQSYAAMMQSLVPAAGSVRAACAAKLGIAEDHAILERLAWLGLFSEKVVQCRTASYLDALSDIMQAKMSYQDGERDLVVMQHQFIIAYPDRRERVNSTMLAYGKPHGDSAMAETVSLPAAIAARMLLEGKIDATGVHIPNDARIYTPVMAEMRRLGVHFEETREVL